MYRLKLNELFKIMQIVKYHIVIAGLFYGFTPSFAFNCTHNQIIIANERRINLFHRISYQGFYFVFV